MVRKIESVALMRRQTEFYEVEKRKVKLNVIIVAISIITLLLTGTIFAARSSVDAAAMTDVQTAADYQAAMEMP